MVDRTVTTQIDVQKCTGCGLCINVCPSETLALKEGKAAVVGNQSLSCGHCMAVCPESAIQVGAIDPAMTRFNTFKLDSRWLAPGKSSPAELSRLMASRRSCRNYLPENVDMKVLEDLVKIGSLAASGTNSQQWTYTCLAKRSRVEFLGSLIKQYFKKLNSTARNPVLRRGLKLMGKKELDGYYRDYYESVEEAIALMETQGIDRLFHGAPALIIIGSKPDASCPAEDALLATGNILLGAHAMGLGTCLIGFAVNAMKRDTSIQDRIGIPGDEQIYSVIALGYPDEIYRTVTGRKKATMRVLD
ncbi:MAG: 4Fe-4S dicluster domain-containing protein [Desulfobacteraceae bacterium]|nr:MAG: 4Fe-4S dicluster domain-containing protein [Desulfobacteraceae bacterium]